MGKKHGTPIRSKWFCPEKLQLVSDSVFCKKYPAIFNVLFLYHLGFTNSKQHNDIMASAVQVRSWNFHLPHICNERHLLVSFCETQFVLICCCNISGQIRFVPIRCCNISGQIQFVLKCCCNISGQTENSVKQIGLLAGFSHFLAHFLLPDSLHVHDTDILKRHRSGLAISGFRDH